MIAYRAMLDVPREVVQRVGWLLHRHRRELGTRKGTRRLTCFQQAVFAMAWLRTGNAIPLLGAGFGLSRSTSYRYVGEAVTVLACEAPDLHEALTCAKDQGAAYVILDGTLIETDRCHEKTESVKGETIDVWFSGKAHTRSAGKSRWDHLSTYVYQVLQGPWGIRVALTARVSMAPKGTMVTIPATESITFALLPELYELLGASGVAHLVHGAQAAQPFAGDRLQRPIVVVIENIRFVESDFQDDGLAAAVYGWLGEELEAPFPSISVAFDRQQNRYHFEWP